MVTSAYTWGNLSREEKLQYVRLLRTDGYTVDAIGAFFGVTKNPIAGFIYKHLKDLTGLKGDKDTLSKQAFEDLFHSVAAEPEESLPEAPPELPKTACPERIEAAAVPARSYSLPQLAAHSSIQCTATYEDGKRCAYTADSCPIHRSQ